MTQRMTQRITQDMNDSQPTLLVVDDQEVNRDLIGEYLLDQPYTLDYAADGQEAWDKLKANPRRYQTVLLDRMMPRMNGIELLTRMKADAELSAIPVILQTAAASPDEIQEGMQLGAYYYLAKPFPRQALEAVVATALAESQNLHDLHDSLDRAQRVLHLLAEARFAFSTLEEARTLAAELANRARQPVAVVMGLSEILINAVEHGNLGISYAEKSRLLSEGQWNDEIARRLDDPRYSTRRAHVHCEFNTHEAELTVIDEGDGFDWTHYLEMQPDRAFDLHGRGIAVARKLSFTSLEYLGNGNTVRLTFPLADA